MPCAILPPVLNTPQRNSGIWRPTQLYRMKEPRLLPKKPNSVTPSDVSFAIRDLMSSRIRAMSSGRISGSASVKTALVVSYATT